MLLLEAALLFGLCGDVILEYGYFVLGLSCFLLGHIFYAIMFTRMTPRYFGPLQLLPILLYVSCLVPVFPRPLPLHLT